MEITQEEVRKRFYYHEGHLHYRETVNYNARKGERAGSLGSKGYIQIKINQKMHLEHRLVFLYHKGYYPKQIDHINHKPSDNRIENIREADQTLNNANQKPKDGGNSRFKGVTFEKRSHKNPWQARIKVDRCHKHIGMYPTEEEAAIAYDKAAFEAWGDYALTNKQAGLL